MPHYDLPFRFENGQIATSDDDGAKEITDCATNVLATPQGWLEWQPELGRPDFAFTAGGVDPAVVEDLILQGEDRATPQIVEQLLGRVDELTVSEVVTGG